MEYEVLNIVDELADIEFMSEMAVIDSMMDAYMKQALMLEYVSEEVVQEGVFKDAIGRSDENIFKRIFLFIPRLIKSIIKWISNKFSKTPKTATTTAKKTVSAVKSLDNTQYEKLEQVTETIDKVNSSIKGMPSDEEIHKAAVQMQQKMIDAIATRPDLQVPGKRYTTSKGDVVKDGEVVAKVAPLKDLDQIEKAVKRTLSDLNHKGFRPAAKSSIRDEVLYGGRIYITDMVRAMRSGEIRIQFSIDDLNKNLKYWEMVLDTIEKALVEFDAGNMEKFEKMVIDLYEKNKNKKHHPEYHTKSGMASDIVNGYTITRIHIDEYNQQIYEMQDQIKALQKRLYSVEDHFDHGDYDYGKAYTYARKRDAQAYDELESQFKSKYGENFDKHDGHNEEFQNKHNKTSGARLHYAVEQIYTTLGRMANALRCYDDMIDSDIRVCRDIINWSNAIGRHNSSGGNSKYDDMINNMINSPK